jgi:hypothetical protein
LEREEEKKRLRLQEYEDEMERRRIESLKTNKKDAEEKAR